MDGERCKEAFSDLGQRTVALPHEGGKTGRMGGTSGSCGWGWERKAKDSDACQASGWGQKQDDASREREQGMRRARFGGGSENSDHDRMKFEEPL